VPEPDVAIDSAGNFLLVWDQPSGDVRRVFGRFVDAAGNGITPPIPVSAPAHIATRPSVARIDEDDQHSEFVVVWESLSDPDTIETSIHQAAFTLDRTTRSVSADGAFVLADTNGGVYPFHPALSSTGDGRFVVVWAENSGTGPNGIAGVFSDTATPFSFLTATPNDLLRDPDVALATDGRAVVTWAESFEIVGTVLDPAMTASPALETLNLFTGGLEGEPAVAVRGGDSSSFAAVWHGETSEFDGVFGRAFDATGGSPQIQVNSSTAGTQRFPDIAVDGRCNTEVVWLDKAVNQVKAQRFDSENRFLGGELEVSAGRGDGSPFGAPRVTVAPDGRFFVTWANATEIFVHTLAPSLTGTCPTAGAGGLPLANGRYRVEVAWRDFAGNGAQGIPRMLTGSVGAFWFFNAENLEVFVKIIPGGPDRFWLFLSGLTNVEVEVTVTDTVTGTVNQYFNPLGNPFPPIRDTLFLAPSPAAPQPPHEVEGAPLFRQAPNGETCLHGGRFCLSVEWTLDAERFGTGRGVPLGDSAVYHWFFQPQNIETFFKVIDGCGINNHYWLFGAGMTDLDLRITVRDVVAGVEKVYTSPGGQPFEAILDTVAFTTCP
jgi:hypothetical protein